MEPQTLLSQRRQALGLTQEAVARAACVSLSYYGLLDRGEKDTPTVHIARRIAEALGTTVDALWPAPTAEGPASSATAQPAGTGSSEVAS